VFVFIIIIFTFLFSGNQLTQAYIDTKFLNNGWIDSGERNRIDRFFGLEKQDTFKYVVDSDFDNYYPSFLTVTTIKTFFTMSEEELLVKTVETIYNAANKNNISIDNESRYEGSRVLYNAHESNFVIFNGTESSGNVSESVKLIGETWNCPRSGTSIICIGVAQTTNNANEISREKLDHWIEIIGDDRGSFNQHYNSNSFTEPNGLIFNVKCH
jgi:hypothetical protein